MSALTEPFAYAFFQRALLAAVAVGALCGAVGVFVVLRRMSYIGHGLAHSVLGGVAVALALDIGMYWGAAAATLVSGLLIDRITRRPGLHADAAIGIVTTAMFALGVAVISVTLAVRVNLENLLFGNILGLRDVDLVLAAVVAALTFLLLLTAYRPLLAVTFDPVVARVQGVRTGATELLFNVLVAAVVITSVRVLGVLLIAAAIVVPAATARLLTRDFGVLLLVSTGLGAMFGVTGLYGSFYLDVPSGPAIVLVGVAIFALVAAVTGVLAQTRLVALRRSLRPTAGPGAAVVGRLRAVPPAGIPTGPGGSPPRRHDEAPSVEAPPTSR